MDVSAPLPFFPFSLSPDSGVRVLVPFATFSEKRIRGVESHEGCSITLLSPALILGGKHGVL